MLNPIYFANRLGIPRIATSGVSVDTDKVTYTVLDLDFLGRGFSGLVLLKIVQPITSDTTTTLPIVLANSKGTTTSVMADMASNLTVADVVVGTHIAYYDASTNTFQLIA